MIEEEEKNSNLQCTQCSRFIPASQIQLNRTVFKLPCNRGHFRHAYCHDGCRKCTCPICGQLIETNESTQVATCFCKFHLGCLPVRYRFLPGSSYYVCPRHKRRVYSISPRIPEPTSIGAFLYGTFSAWELKRQDVNMYDPVTLSASEIIQSDVSVIDLMNAGFSLHDFLRFGIDGETFLRRFFAPAIVFHLLPLGAVHGYASDELVTGESFMRAFGLTMENLLIANVGLLSGPPESQAGAYVPFQACHVIQMGLSLQNLEEFNMTFGVFFRLRGSPTEWRVVSHGIGKGGNLRWVSTLTCEDMYKNARGTALADIGWPRQEIQAIGLDGERDTLKPDPSKYTSNSVLDTLVTSMLSFQRLAEPVVPLEPDKSPPPAVTVKRRVL